MLDKLKRILAAKERENYVEKTPQDVYEGISMDTGIPAEEIAQIGALESQHGKYQDNMAGSSAKGIMQVMPLLAKTIRPGSEKSIKDMNTQQALASDIINMNQPTIKEIRNGGADILDHYVMYNLGKGRGKKLLEADDNAKITDILPKEVINSNPKLYKHATVGEAKKAIKQILSSGDMSGYTPKLEDLIPKEEKK